MSDRGIKKWNPYRTLNEQDFTLAEHKNKEEKIEKPTISTEFAEEINEILVNYHGEILEIEYYKNGRIIKVKGTLKKIDPYERKIILSTKKIIMLSDITSIIRSDDEEEEDI